MQGCRTYDQFINKYYDELILVRGLILHQFLVQIFLVGAWICNQAFNFSSEYNNLIN